MLMISTLDNLIHKEKCTTLFEKSLDDVRGLNSEKIIYVFGKVFIISDLPEKGLLQQGEYLRVSNCSRDGWFNSYKKMKVEETIGLILTNEKFN